MSDIQIFKNANFGEVRVTEVNGNPMFCLVDVCRVLDLSNPTRVKSRIEDDLTTSAVIYDSLGRATMLSHELKFAEAHSNVCVYMYRAICSTKELSAIWNLYYHFKNVMF